jgi:hypothetical protein
MSTGGMAVYELVIDDKGMCGCWRAGRAEKAGRWRWYVSGWSPAHKEALRPFAPLRSIVAWGLMVTWAVICE